MTIQRLGYTLFCILLLAWPVCAAQPDKVDIKTIQVTAQIYMITGKE